MKLYLDTGIFIDYLARRGLEWSGLRASGRRGRDLAKILEDADQLLNRASGKHRLATSALTYYEVEEALYRRLAAAIKQVPKEGARHSRRALDDAPDRDGDTSVRHRGP